MTRFVLDTNLYVRAFRSAPEAAELRRFYHARTHATYLSSVVLHELLIGASTPAHARQVETEIAAGFRRTGRIVTPSASAWEQAADVVAYLGRHDGLDRSAIPQGFIHDALIAASCREHGLTLITQNTRDFLRIQKRLKFQFTAPWPN